MDSSFVNSDDESRPSPTQRAPTSRRRRAANVDPAPATARVELDTVARLAEAVGQNDDALKGLLLADMAKERKDLRAAVSRAEDLHRNGAHDSEQGLLRAWRNLLTWGNRVLAARDASGAASRGEARTNAGRSDDARLAKPQAAPAPKRAAAAAGAPMRVDVAIYKAPMHASAAAPPLAARAGLLARLRHLTPQGAAQMLVDAWQAWREAPADRPLAEVLDPESTLGLVGELRSISVLRRQSMGALVVALAGELEYEAAKPALSGVLDRLGVPTARENDADARWVRWLASHAAAAQNAWAAMERALVPKPHARQCELVHAYLWTRECADVHAKLRGHLAQSQSHADVLAALLETPASLVLHGDVTRELDADARGALEGHARLATWAALDAPLLTTALFQAADDAGLEAVVDHMMVAIERWVLRTAQSADADKLLAMYLGRTAAVHDARVHPATAERCAANNKLKDILAWSRAGTELRAHVAKCVERARPRAGALASEEYVHALAKERDGEELVELIACSHLDAGLRRQLAATPYAAQCAAERRLAHLAERYHDAYRAWYLRAYRAAAEGKGTAVEYARAHQEALRAAGPPLTDADERALEAAGAPAAAAAGDDDAEFRVAMRAASRLALVLAARGHPPSLADVPLGDARLWLFRVAEDARDVFGAAARTRELAAAYARAAPSPAALGALECLLGGERCVGGRRAAVEHVEQSPLPENIRTAARQRAEAWPDAGARA